jgi:hypothetical protein
MKRTSASMFGKLPLVVTIAASRPLCGRSMPPPRSLVFCRLLKPLVARIGLSVQNAALPGWPGKGAVAANSGRPHQSTHRSVIENANREFFPDGKFDATNLPRSRVCMNERFLPLPARRARKG